MHGDLNGKYVSGPHQGVTTVLMEEKSSIHQREENEALLTDASITFSTGKGKFSLSLKCMFQKPQHSCAESQPRNAVTSFPGLRPFLMTKC